MFQKGVDKAPYKCYDKIVYFSKPMNYYWEVLQNHEDNWTGYHWDV